MAATNARVTIYGRERTPSVLPSTGEIKSLDLHSGNSIVCSCGEIIYDHPRIVGYPGAFRLCNGTTVRIA